MAGMLIGGARPAAAFAQTRDDARVADPATASESRPIEHDAAPRALPLTPLNISLLHPVSFYPDAQLRRIGVELAVLYGATGSTTGVAVGGVVLQTRDDVEGFMLAPVNLIGRELDGVQLGLVNVAKRVKGVQLGLVNVSQRASGLQLGIVNVGETDGYQIGLLNLPPSLRVSALLWGAGLPMLVSAGARFSTTRSPVYTLIALGYGHDATHGFVAPAYGLGLRASPQRWLLDVDLLYQPEFATQHRTRHVLELRASVGLRVVNRLAPLLGAGPALEIAHSKKPNPAARAFGGVELLF